MPITIPQTVKEYCKDKKNTEAINSIIKAIGTINAETLDDYLRNIEIELFVNKFKYDMWKFKYDLWKAVWGNVLENKKYKDLVFANDCCPIDQDPYNCFYVKYSFKKKKYNLGVCGINGESDEINILASEIIEEKSSNIFTEKAIISEDTDILENDTYVRSKDTYTASKHIVRVSKVGKITQPNIDNFREAAENMLNIIVGKDKN